MVLLISLGPEQPTRNSPVHATIQPFPAVLPYKPPASSMPEQAGETFYSAVERGEAWL